MSLKAAYIVNLAAAAKNEFANRLARVRLADLLYGLVSSQSYMAAAAYAGEARAYIYWYGMALFSRGGRPRSTAVKEMQICAWERLIFVLPP